MIAMCRYTMKSKSGHYSAVPPILTGRGFCIYYRRLETFLTRGEKMVIKKIAVTAASAMLVATMVFAARPAYATTKVDCDAVMGELNGGKKAKEVAKDLSISTSSVYRCKKHAKEAAKAGTKSTVQAKTGKEAASPAMAAPSPAAAASPAKK